ncbi:unnamed protein product [Allacma fusca]|uniref:Uncharacterized protein n=1 Tax=Allacma fusca TaxID=39272 RepID=A0A8J2JUP4_9HEXA|nr:unnamed protein product [Allacma fusca]
MGKAELESESEKSIASSSNPVEVDFGLDNEVRVKQNFVFVSFCILILENNPFDGIHQKRIIVSNGLSCTKETIRRMTSRHQFHLRWSNYGHNLANSFIKLYESESLADVTLFCEGESYRAHRVVLAASSDHFQELFEQCSTAQNLVVILDGTSAANLRALLEFMYKGEVYIDDANLNTFLQTAKRLKVKGLSLSQNDLHSMSNDIVEERSEVSKMPSFSSGPSQVNILAQALGPLLLPQQQSQQPQPPPPQLNKTTNSVQSPPTSFSSPSPSQTPPTIPTTSGLYVDEKMRKKIRITSPRHTSPEGTIPENIDYGGHHHTPKASVPLPSPTMNPRLMEIDPSVSRSSMVPGFQPFQPHYSAPGPPPGGHQQPQQQQQQQQTIVITENPNIRKIRSASTENTMPEDLSIKLEVGREEEFPGSGGKQRSFSMDLSPSEPPFGGLGAGGPGPSNVWSLPSPSTLSAQHTQQHDLNLNNAQSTADGKKLKCPFCERLYGYETNLRAHIRQRHQGIRVPCPFCTRTFTRNNTVRRHVAREHRALLGGVRAFHHPHMNPESGPPPPFGSPPSGSTTSSPSQGSPSTSTSASSGSVTTAGGMPLPVSQHMIKTVSAVSRFRSPQTIACEPFSCHYVVSHACWVTIASDVFEAHNVKLSKKAESEN